MIYKNQVLVFVVSFVIIGFFILSAPKSGFSGVGVLVRCCQETESSCFDLGPGNDVCKNVIREGERCNTITGQCEAKRPPPRCCQTGPSSCFDVTSSEAFCPEGIREGEICSVRSGQCGSPPAVTFPCTDTDCQSQQNCENPAICSGDDSTPCFWTGTECLNSPPEPTPTPTATPTSTPAPTPTVSPTPTPTPIEGTDLRCCHSEGFETCIGGCEGCAIPTDECTAAGGIPSVGILNTFCDPRATDVVCTGGATGCCVLFEGNCEDEETILDCGSLAGIRWFESSCEEVPQCQPIPPLPTPTPTPGAFQPGDANGDGEINILDVTALLNHILVISSAPGNGDCNEDGEVNILDVTCVLNIILGL